MEIKRPDHDSRKRGLEEKTRRPARVKTVRDSTAATDAPPNTYQQIKNKHTLCRPMTEKRPSATVFSRA